MNIKSKYLINLHSQKYLLEASSPFTRLVSSEYYFTFSTPKRVTVKRVHSNFKCREVNLHTIPYGYRRDSIKFFFFHFSKKEKFKNKKILHILNAIIKNSIQFPLIIITGNPNLEKIRSLLNLFEDIAAKEDMYFLLYLFLKKYIYSLDKIFSKYRSVYYNSYNRVYLKVFKPIKTCNQNEITYFLKNDIPFDLYYNIEESRDILCLHSKSYNGAMKSFFDSYSNREVVVGPNIWIDFKNTLPPKRVIRLHDKMKKLRLKKIYFHSSLQRFFNLLPVQNNNLIKETMVFNENGDVFSLNFSNMKYKGNVLDGDLKSIIASDFKRCNEDCLSLRLFCNRDPSQCKYFKSIVYEFCEEIIKS